MFSQNQANIFCIFHDGSFTEFSKNQSDIEFTIDIQYLAELINPKFSVFKGKLKNCTKLQYHVWGKEHKVIYDLNTLGVLYLEIAHAEVTDNYITVKCFSDDVNCGGDLMIIADDIIIYDEAEQEVTFDKLKETSKLYWITNLKD